MFTFTQVISCVYISIRLVWCMCMRLCSMRFFVWDMHVRFVLDVLVLQLLHSTSHAYSSLFYAADVSGDRTNEEKVGE